MLTRDDLVTLEQALSNYKALWDDFLVEINDGSWHREATEDQIKKFEELVDRTRKALDSF